MHYARSDAKKPDVDRARSQLEVRSGTVKPREQHVGVTHSSGLTVQVPDFGAKPCDAGDVKHANIDLESKRAYP